MLSTSRIKRKFGDNICRRCINRRYKVHLTPKDCRYGYYYACRSCHELHHIVTDFTLSGHLKMLFK